MKKQSRLIALFLTCALLLSMIGCTAKKGSETAPTDPGADIYTQARAALDSASAVTLELLVTTNTTVDGNLFTERSSQTLTYNAIGTDDAVIALEEEYRSYIHSEDFDPDDDPVCYKEIWTQGTVYTELEDTHRYSSPVDAQAAATRYAPVVLLNQALYGSITSEDTEDGTTITFADPTAAEEWAMPQNGTLTEATGSAIVSADGAITEMNYKITYTYGPSEVVLEVQSKPKDTPETVAAPEDPDDYTELSYADAPYLSMRIPALLAQVDSTSSSGLQSITSQAAGVVLNQSTTVHTHGHKKDTKAKIETGIYMMDYSTMQSEEYDLEETFLDGKLTTVVDNGLPSIDGSVDWEDISSYTTELIQSGLLEIDYWEDVTVTDMGDVYLLEYALNDDFGNTTQNEICDTLWYDASFLYNLSSDYKNTDLNGYLSVDRYTGLPVAAGFYYEGVHTIDGQDYTLSLQFDQSIETPAKGAYKEITDEMLPEEEPEVKPTPLFYHVTGKDGQEMWLLGTIHVGDERTAYLPEEIRNAFAASDALALECDTEAFDEQVEKDDALSEQVSNLYFYDDPDKTLENQMDDEAYDYAVKYLKSVGGYNMNLPYAKPYLWSSIIDEFRLRQGYQLHRDQGVESRLYDWAKETGKEIREVESSLFQIKMLTGFSDELQLYLLETSMEYTMQEYCAETMDMYEKWCAGDEAALREIISDDPSNLTEEEQAEYEAVKHLIDEYNKAVSLDRNEGMLQKAIEYLESGDVIFYAVGLAHLLDNTNGLVDTLQEAGYTVEPVTYSN